MAKSEKTPRIEGKGSTVKYIGSAASYTIGNVRFETGQVKEIECEHMEAALSCGKFEAVL